MTTSQSIEAAGDPLPASSELTEVRVAELQQLFNAVAVIGATPGMGSAALLERA